MSEEFNDKSEVEEQELENDMDESEAAPEKSPVKANTKSVPAKTETKKKVRKKNPLARWFREMKSELKKVVWPTPKQIVNNTSVALVVMVVSAIAIWAVDQIGSQIFRMLITLGS